MSLRPPRSSSCKPEACALETALAALADYDRIEVQARSAARERIVRRAGYALWCFIVQREACGLRDQRLVMRDYRISREVRSRMGVLDSTDRPASAQNVFTVS